MRFVSKSVVIGFVNALAILIFMAQLPELINVTWHVYAFVALVFRNYLSIPSDFQISKITPFSTSLHHCNRIIGNRFTELMYGPWAIWGLYLTHFQCS